MFASFEEKGKIFTNVISKVPVDAIIQTSHQRIEGKIYIRPDDRLKDELDKSDYFLAVTDATVFAEDGSALYKTKFVLLHRDHIVWIIPAEEEQDPGSEE